jgi:aminoglycoside phosphotransferase (APT) family kinase protein
MGTRKMHVDELDTSEILVRHIVDAQSPHWSHLPIKALKTAGTDNALFRLGDEMVVRLPRTLSASKQIDKELRWLPKLAPFLPLAIPKPLFAGMPAEGFPWHWSVYQWIDGEDASIETVVDEHEVAGTLAEFLIALQRIDVTGGPFPGDHNFFRGEPLAMRDKNTRAVMHSLESIFDLDIMLKIWDAAVEAPVWNKPPCWIHGDLIPTNLLIQKGRLSAVIDFGGLGVGDPACDLIIAWTFLSAQTRDSFRKMLSVDEATWLRGRGWALSMGVNAFEYYQQTNPVLARIAKYAILEAIADYKYNS